MSSELMDALKALAREKNIDEFEMLDRLEASLASTYQRILDLDNATRSLVPRAEIVSALNGESAAFRAAIDVPVLLMQADGDHLFVPLDDSALFSGSPDVSFALLRHAGHKGFSHPTSKEQAVRTVRGWLRSRF